MGDSEAGVWVEEVSRRSLPPSPTILDVGIGDGASITKRLLALKRLGHESRLVGVDPESEANHAQLVKRDLPGTVIHKVAFESFSTKTQFDVVNSTHSLYYFEDIPATVGRMIDHAREGGILVLTVWSESCVLSELHSMTFGIAQSTVTGECVRELLLSRNDVEDVVGVLASGRVDLQHWLTSDRALDAALRVISRKAYDPRLAEGAKRRLVTELQYLPSIGMRKNLIVLASKKFKLAHSPVK